MKFKAVIFDLFGTLVNKFPVDESIDVLIEMAAVLSVPVDDFIQLWFDTFDKRHSGAFPNLEADIEYVCRILGVKPEAEQTRTAAQINLDYVAKNMIPRPEVIELLAALREKEYKVGLISNWSDEVPSVWKGNLLAGYFDTAVFSCKAGVMKPDPRIYLMAAEQLSVGPGDCLYIGDGDSMELDGALKAGMEAVLLRRTDEGNGDTPVKNRETGEWTGREISSLTNVMKLLK